MDAAQHQRRHRGLGLVFSPPRLDRVILPRKPPRTLDGVKLEAKGSEARNAAWTRDKDAEQPGTQHPEPGTYNRFSDRILKT